MEKKVTVPEGFQSYSVPTIGYVSSDGEKLYMNSPQYKIMVTGQSDLLNLPDDLPPGTVAFTADKHGEWRKTANSKWQSATTAEIIG